MPSKARVIAFSVICMSRIVAASTGAPKDKAGNSIISIDIVRRIPKIWPKGERSNIGYGTPYWGFVYTHCYYAELLFFLMKRNG